jgi:O-antigen ligase
MIVLSQPIQKTLALCALLPLSFAPFLSVEFPRVLAFLPLITIIFCLPLNGAEIKNGLYAFKHAFGFFAFLLATIFVHNYFVADFNEAKDRLCKLWMILAGGGVFLSCLWSMRAPPLKQSLKLMLICCSLGALLIAFELRFGAPVYRFVRDIPEGEIFSTSVYNRGALAISLLSLTVFLLSKTKKQLFFLFAFAPIVMMLFMVQSQSAQLVFVFGLLFYFLFPASSKIFWGLLWMGVVLAMLSKPFLVSYIYDHLPAFVDEMHFFKHSYVGARFEVWDYISQKVFDAPIFGHGIEFTRTYDEFETQARYSNVTSVLHPHSFIMQLWIEFGAVGILLAISVFTAILSFIYRRLRGNERRAALAMFLSFLVVSGFSYGMWQSWWLGLAFIMTGWFVLVVRNTEKVA